MTPKERLIKVLFRQPVDRPPVAVPTQNATVTVMRQAEVYWPDALRFAEPMAELALACQRIYGFESLRLPFDINVEAETMGCATRYGGEADPPVSKPKNREELDELFFPDPAVSGRMAEVIKAVSLVAAAKDAALPLIAALGTPFEVLCTVYNFDHLRADMKSGHERLAALLEKILELQTAYGKLLASSGADVLMLVDGTSQTLIPTQFQEFSASYTQRLIGALDMPCILHICGNPQRLIPGMAATGARAFSLDWPVDVAKARQDAPDVAFIGALNVTTLLEGGPGDVVGMVEKARASDFDIIAPGCGVMPQTPLENIRAYVNAVISA